MTKFLFVIQGPADSLNGIAEQNKAKQNRTLLGPEYCSHFPIPNNASLESDNIAALTQLTLLVPPIEEDTSWVVCFWEDKDEWLITWFTDILVSQSPDTRGQCWCTNGAPCTEPCVSRASPGPRLLHGHRWHRNNSGEALRREGAGGVKPGYLYPVRSRLFLRKFPLYVTG